MISKIKHIGIMSQNAPRLFKFYECLFDLRKASNEVSPSQEAERGRSFGYPILASKRVASPFDRTIIASDGNIGVAFNRRRPGYNGGLDHFGIQVDDLETVFARIKEKYPAVGVVKRPSNIAKYGLAADEIISLGRETPDNLIAMCTHGRSGVKRWVLGSVTETVVRHSGDPVLVIRAA